MMNTYMKKFIVLVLVVITISACSPQSETTSESSTPSISPQNETTSDLPDPSAILVGHWRSPEDWQEEGKLELYFGNFDENGDALCYFNTTLDKKLTPYGELMPFTCHIYREEEYNLWMGLHLEDGTVFETMEVIPGKYGKRILFDRDPLFYIDSNTEP
jgi:hypothetical protein